MEFDIGEIIIDEELEVSEIEFDTVKEYPELEDLEVTPTSIEQNFNHPNSYGYNNVKVKAVSSDTLDITPSTESQQHVGLYGIVNVAAVDSSIDSDIKAENIKQGVEILGVEGTVEELVGEEITVKSISEEQVIFPSENKNAFTKVTVEAVKSEYVWEGNSTNFSNVTITPTFDKFIYKETHPTRLNIGALLASIADDMFFTFRTIPQTYTLNIISQSLRQCTAKRIGFGVSLSSATTMVLMFYGCSDLEEIYGEPFDTSGITSVGNMPNFSGCSNLEKIFFKENTTKYNINFNQSPLLTDDTLISIANGLNENAAGQTLQLHATSKTKCSSIMGTVDSHTYTYKVFIPNTSGTTSLEEFITIEKGWSLA